MLEKNPNGGTIFCMGPNARDYVRCLNPMTFEWFCEADTVVFAYNTLVWDTALDRAAPGCAAIDVDASGGVLQLTVLDDRLDDVDDEVRTRTDFKDDDDYLLRPGVGAMDKLLCALPARLRPTLGSVMQEGGSSLLGPRRRSCTCGSTAARHRRLA